MTYYVLVCPERQCRGVSIKDERTERTRCSKCHEDSKFEDYRISYRADTKDEAVAARTKLLTQLDDDAPSFEEVKEQGALDDDVGRVYERGAEKDTRTPTEKLNDAIDAVETPTREEIVAQAVEEGLSEDKATKVFERMVQKGHLIKNHGEYEKL